MTQEELQSKITELQKSQANFAQGARTEIARRQQELEAFIKTSQKNLDNMEGQIIAYSDMLKANAPEPIVIGGEAKEVPVEVLSKEAT